MWCVSTTSGLSWAITKLDRAWSAFVREGTPKPDRLTTEQIQFGLNFDDRWKTLAAQDDKAFEKLLNPHLFEDMDEDATGLHGFLTIFASLFVLRMLNGIDGARNRTISALVRGIVGYADSAVVRKPQEPLRPGTPWTSKAEHRLRERVGSRPPDDPPMPNTPFQT